MNPSKIAVVTGTRAEYGLLRRIIRMLHDSDETQLQLIVTGMHLSPEFGLTYREIEADGIPIQHRVQMLLSSDSCNAIAKSMGLGMIGFADAYTVLKPDIVVGLGDRFELLAAVSAALSYRIPVAHIHGGESTEGLIDEGIRHAVTKMSHLHFTATEDYRSRVIQLGEQPDRVLNVGGLGVDAIRHVELLNKDQLEESLGFRFGDRNLLVTFHPVTLEAHAAEQQIEALLCALTEYMQQMGGKVIFTMPNADAEGRVILHRIRDYTAENVEQSMAYESMGQLRYLSTLKYVDGVVGNSSSGLTEVPSFKIGTVNIGHRQRGRARATSIIDCEPDRVSISRAIRRLYDPEFAESLADVVNPYGDGGASERIVDRLREGGFSELLVKRFYDLEHCA